MPAQPASSQFTSPARFDRDYIAESLKSILGSAVKDVACAPLLGDASDRTYFRVTFAEEAKSSGSGSLILMQLKEPVSGPETDFTRILKFLRTLQLPVPELFYYDSAKGILFLEDCGDTTLEDWIRDHPGDREKYYREAVDLLSRLHQRATKHVGPDCPAYHLRFDVEKLMWEFDFMLQHYVGGLMQSPLNEQEAGEIRRHFRPLCETLAAEKLTFTHRDFHSRNLMAHKGGLVILDFQDARMGPCQYDLVSLLKDSYLRLDDGFRREMIDLFIELKEKEESAPVNRREFYRIFDWMSIQRNLKAVGTFAYQSCVRGNDRYLEYIPGTLAYVRKTLQERSDLHDLNETLKKYLPGLQGEFPGEQ